MRSRFLLLTLVLMLGLLPRVGLAYDISVSLPLGHADATTALTRIEMLLTTQGAQTTGNLKTVGILVMNFPAPDFTVVIAQAPFPAPPAGILSVFVTCRNSLSLAGAQVHCQSLQRQYTEEP
jgi:hypothetical protein